MGDEQQWYLIQKILHECLEGYYDVYVTLGLCRSEAEGKVICDQLRKENGMLDKAVKHIHEADEAWHGENPVPNETPYPDIPKIKKWGGNIRQSDITQEMRDEREKTKALIVTLRKEYSEAREAELVPYYDTQRIYFQEVTETYLSNHPELDEFPNLKNTIREWNDGGRGYWKHRFAKNTSYEIKPIPILT